MSNSIRKGYVSRDSLEACDPQTDIYYTIRNPNAPPRPAPAAPATLDTIETLQKKLELEAQQRLVPGDGGFASEKMKILASITKFIFMAVMLPPYLIMYSFPKFMLTKALPRSLKILFSPINRTVQALADIAATLRSRFDKVVSFFKIAKGDETRSDGRALFQRMLHPFVTALTASRRLLTAPFCIAKNMVDRAVETARKYISTKANRVKDAVANAANAAKRRLYNQFEKLGNLLHRAIVQPVADWASPKALALRDAFSKASRRLVNAADKVRESVAAFAKNPVQTIVHTTNAAVQWIAATAANLAAPAADWAKMRIGDVAAIARDFRAQVYDLVVDRYELAKEQVRDWAVTTTRSAKQAANILWNGIIHIPEQIARLFPKAPAEWLRKGKRWGGEKYRHAKEHLATNFRKAADSLKAGLVRGARELRSIMAAWLSKLLVQLKALPYKLWMLAKKVGSLLLAGIKKTIFGLRVVLAWSRVLFKFGMQLVRDAAHELTSSLAAWIRS